jgi:hypothetical protein
MRTCRRSAVRAETQTIRKSSELGKVTHMGRRRKGEPPRYRLHKQSGQAVVSLPKGDGTYHDVLLGPFDTPESRAEYARVLAEWEANGQTTPPRHNSTSDLTVNEVILPYWRHVEGYYRHADGRPTSEVHNIKLALRPLKKLYGHTRAADFDSLALEALREQMIRDGLCRNRINKDVARIKRVFTWAASKKLLPVAVPQLLATVEGLRAGRSAACETPKVKPVADEVVEATLPHLRPQVAAMVRLQRSGRHRNSFHSGAQEPALAVDLRRDHDVDLPLADRLLEPVAALAPGAGRGPR